MKSRLKYRGKKIKLLETLPQITDPEKIALIRILSSIAPSIYISKPDYIPFIIFTILDIISACGNDLYSPYIFSAYGFLLAAGFDDIERGFEFGELGIKLGKKFSSKLMEGRAYYHYSWIAQWKEHLNENTVYLQKSAQLFLEDGDILYAAYSYLHIPEISLLTGRPLDTVKTVYDEYAFIIKKLDQHATGQYLKILRQSLDNLSGDAPDKLIIEGDYFSEKINFPEIQKSGDLYAMGCFFIVKTFVLFLYNRYHEALDCCNNEKIVVGGMFSQPQVYFFYFLYALILSALIPTVQKKEKKIYLKKLKWFHKKFRLWSRYGTCNYLHKYQLISAELSRISGKKSDADALYREAVKGAAANGFVHEEAIACERAAKFYLSIDMKRSAGEYMTRAVVCYSRWGAREKIRELESEYSDLLYHAAPLEKMPDNQDNAEYRDTGMASAATTLDFSTVIKASQAISGEIDLQNLLTRIMNLVIENAGAHKGFLLLERDGKLVIEAEIDSSRVCHPVLHSRFPEDSDDLSSGIVNYSAHTREIVILNDAVNEGDFKNDAYVLMAKPASILCMPLLILGRLHGILYLENNHSKAAFTTERIMVLKILAAQAAISIRNAYFIQEKIESERETKRLNEELQSTVDELESANIELFESRNALIENENRLRKMIKKSPMPTIIIDKNNKVEHVNDKFTGLFGYTLKDVLTEEKLWQVFYPDEEYREKFQTFRMLMFGKTRNDKTEMEMQEWDITIKDGSKRNCEFFMVPLDDFYLIIMNDITDRKRAADEKARLENQIHQTQKMESIGQLAGGVAHDFNNMLGVIMGHAELAMLAIDTSQPLYDHLQEILKAADHSASLTRQLLAFARKQTVSPQVLDINNTISGVLNMLLRLIGEHIHLSWQPQADLWPVRIDPSQINQILVNLCVNARDAISDGGKITIETGKIEMDAEYCAHHPGFEPGKYVLLAVSDDGCGMTPEILSQIYEPFFTTKSVGSGTGLGMATVYGIVNQNNGIIDAYSEPEHGTTFRIYLPRYSGATAGVRVEKTEESLVRGHETILVVEDEPAILMLTAEMLKEQGYTVLTASTPYEACRLADENPEGIQLLMTDVVMPGMNGRELAEKLKSLYPHIKILYMSGYSANTIAHRGILDEGVCYIQKPFLIKELAGRVRQVLDEN